MFNKNSIRFNKDLSEPVLTQIQNVLYYVYFYTKYLRFVQNLVRYDL